jgi:hypothetical protein
MGDRTPPAAGTVDWKFAGVRVIKGDQPDTNARQTSGMNRAAAINAARVGARKIRAGTVNIHANAKTGAHHHGARDLRRARQGADAPGASGWNSSPRPGRGISFSCRPLCRTRKSTPARMRLRGHLPTTACAH